MIMKLNLSLLALALSWQAIAADVRPGLRATMEELSPQNCVEQMKGVETTLNALTPADYLRELSQAKTSDLAQELWNFKLIIHERLREFHRDDKLSRSCANSYRGALRAVRYLEDMVYEQEARLAVETEVVGKKGKKKIVIPTAWSEGTPFIKYAPTLQKPLLKDVLQSGDVILSRGNAYTSAAIASLGEYDTQFSHLSLVHIDDKGKVWTVEAHIEVGSFVRPLDDHIEDNNFRTMVFRFDDPAIAKKAASFAFEKVKEASRRTGNILYDFSFSMTDGAEKLFCSEVISHAYETVSENSVMIPRFQSRLQLRKPTFVADIGITADESFVPADIEIDPRFSIVAEWRDPFRVNDSHEKDAVLQAMFAWVDQHDYRLQQGSSWKSFQYRNFAWPLRRTPILNIFVKDKLPINMTRDMIGFFGVLESVGELLHKALMEENKKAIQERGLPLLGGEKYEVLEKVRLADLKMKKRPLHKMFRAPMRRGKK